MSSYLGEKICPKCGGVLATAWGEERQKWDDWICLGKQTGAVSYGCGYREQAPFWPHPRSQFDRELFSALYTNYDKEHDVLYIF